MSIRNLIAVGCLLCFYNMPGIAQTKQKVDIESATVFLNGAELFSRAKVNLPAGESEILFTNIAGNVNQQSLNIGANSGVVVQSATFQNNFLREENLSPRAKDLKDSIDYLEKSRSGINNEMESLNEQVAIIRQNRQVNGANTGLSTTELMKMLDLVKARMAKLLDEKDALAANLKIADERLARLRQQLQEEQQRGFQPGGQLLVKFYSTKATASNITISYVVPNAGWTPSYDLRVDELGGPVKLQYKAHVYQNSGVAWDKIKLSLSTGNPNEGAEAPVLNPWYLQFYMPRPVAYQNKTLMMEDIQKRPSRNVSSVVETAAGAYQSTTLDEYVQTDNSGINTVFDIDLPYTIPSDGQQHNVAIRSAELPATYRYYAVPKIDRDAFLQAQITGWENLDLLPAQTNIFYEGTYVGQGYIDVRNVKDTMNLSLGRDKKIVVRRERDKELRSVKTIGTNVREAFVYKISVRNTRNKPVDIVVIDQIPISNDKDIEVSDRDYKGADYNETTGAVTWKLQLKPNETRELILGYSVKYPKGKQVNL
ncbi:MAG: DUF4139 domain-containing protein [Taibaiella sp.]|nr:DUF4139 domain-containing protein [Taibaiella sp.]